MESKQNVEVSLQAVSVLCQPEAKSETALQTPCTTPHLLSKVRAARTKIAVPVTFVDDLDHRARLLVDHSATKFPRPISIARHSLGQQNAASEHRRETLRCGARIGRMTYGAKLVGDPVAYEPCDLQSTEPLHV